MLASDERWLSMGRMTEFGPQFSGRAGFEAFLRSLLRADWNQEDGPLRLNSALTLVDLGDSMFFSNARIFLSALAETNGTPVTATGNLTRAFVAGVFEKLNLPAGLRSSVRQVCKVINEQDVWPLHIVRIVCECAGLIARRNKRIQLSRTGRLLATEDQAGKLFRALFVGYFRRFDLQYNFPFRQVPGIQQTMAVILWRLQTVAADWKKVQGIAPDLLLPDVHAQLRKAMISEHDQEEWILSGYLLDALLIFGLIERQRPSGWFGVSEKDAIRISPLWRKFIRFVWQEEKVGWN